MKKILLFFLLFGFFSSARAEEIIDLGEDGFVCSLNPGRVESEFKAKTKNLAINATSLPAISFKSGLPRHHGRPVIRNTPLEKSSIPPNTRIFVFSINDPESERIASQINVTYAVCVDYASLDDINAFRQKTMIKYPIQPGNESILESLKVISYPALVTFKENEIEIQEGF